MKKNLIIAALSLLISFATAASAQEPSDDKTPPEKATVEVVGVGATLSEARMDAIRTALQITMKQLVVSDRLIRDDKIVQDKILSTLNGYVEDFKLLEQRAEGSSVSIKAEVTVSPTRMVNFAKSIGGSTAKIKGGAILADTQRELASRQVRGELFARLFRGFPNDAYDIKVLGAQPNNTDPNLLDIKAKIVPNKYWVKQLDSGLRTLVDKSKHALLTPGGNPLLDRTTFTVRLRVDDQKFEYILLPGFYMETFSKVSGLKQTSQAISLAFWVAFSNGSQAEGGCFVSELLEPSQRFLAPSFSPLETYGETPSVLQLKMDTQSVERSVPIQEIKLEESDKVSSYLTIPGSGTAIGHHDGPGHGDRETHWRRIRQSSARHRPHASRRLN